MTRVSARLLVPVAVAAILLVAPAAAGACASDDTSYLDSFPDVTCLLPASLTGAEIDGDGGLRLKTGGTATATTWDTPAQFDDPPAGVTGSLRVVGSGPGATLELLRVRAAAHAHRARPLALGRRADGRPDAGARQRRRRGPERHPRRLEVRHVLHRLRRGRRAAGRLPRRVQRRADVDAPADRRRRPEPGAGADRRRARLVGCRRRLRRRRALRPGRRDRAVPHVLLRPQRGRPRRSATRRRATASPGRSGPIRRCRRACPERATPSRSRTRRCSRTAACSRCGTRATTRPSRRSATRRRSTASPGSAPDCPRACSRIRSAAATRRSASGSSRPRSGRPRVASACSSAPATRPTPTSTRIINATSSGRDRLDDRQPRGEPALGPLLRDELLLAGRHGPTRPTRPRPSSCTSPAIARRPIRRTTARTSGSRPRLRRTATSASTPAPARIPGRRSSPPGPTRPASTRAASAA